MKLDYDTFMSPRYVQWFIDDWRKKMGWEYWSAKDIMNRLTEENGELAREVSHKYGPKRKKKGEKPSSIKEELGDMLYTLLCMANREKVHLGQALEDTLTKYEERDAKRFKRAK